MKKVKKNKAAKPVKKTVKKPVKKVAKKTTKKAVVKTTKKAKPAAKKSAVKAVKKVKKDIKKAGKAVNAAPKTKAAAKKITAVKKQVKKAFKEVKRTIAPKKVLPAKPFVAVSVQSNIKSEKLSNEELRDIRKTLVEMRDDAVARLLDKKNQDMPEAEVGDPIDAASQSLDKEILFELSDSSQILIDQIEAAIRKIDKGLYGHCESCRIVIPKKRVKAMPFARYCVNCQSTNENRGY